MAEGVLRKSTSPEFWAQVQRNGQYECWPWLGRRRGGARNQYGTFKDDQAHRLALQFRLGRALRRDELACHTCDNPICCNPGHLYAGSRLDNARDAVERGLVRGRDQHGAKNGNAKLTPDDVEAIRKRIGRGETNVRIAKDYPVGHAMISKIRTGKFWRSRQDSNL